MHAAHMCIKFLFRVNLSCGPPWSSPMAASVGMHRLTCRASHRILNMYCLLCDLYRTQDAYSTAVDDVVQALRVPVNYALGSAQVRYRTACGTVKLPAVQCGDGTGTWQYSCGGSERLQTRCKAASTNPGLAHQLLINDLNDLVLPGVPPCDFFALPCTACTARRTS